MLKRIHPITPSRHLIWLVMKSFCQSKKGPWNDPEILKMVESGGTLCRHTSLNSDSRMSSYDKPSYSGIKVSDTSTAESGSEVEEMASPKTTNKESHVPKLTPVSEDIIRANAKLNPTDSSEYDSPMVDKVVDVACMAHEKPMASEGSEYAAGLGKIGPVSKICRWLIVFFVNFLTVLVYVVLPKSKGHSQSKSSVDVPNGRECRRPSPSFLERNLIFSVVSRLGDLEKQVETLHSKRHEIPREKEELLNTAVYRVDALESELIAIKRLYMRL